MKIQIRRGVFETNSSSVHTMSIVSNPSKEYPKSITIPVDGEFSWEEEVYTDPETKAAYVFQAFKENSYDNDPFIHMANFKKAIDYVVSTFESHGIKTTYNKKFDLQTVKSKWGDYMTVVGENDKTISGYIDHGNLEDFAEELLNNPESLMSFVFDENSYLITGNDNSGGYPSAPNDLPSKIFEKGN